MSTFKRSLSILLIITSEEAVSDFLFIEISDALEKMENECDVNECIRIFKCLLKVIFMHLNEKRKSFMFGF